MAWFKGNQDRWVKGKWPNGWLWQGCPNIPTTVIPIGQRLIANSQQLQNKLQPVLIISAGIAIVPEPFIPRSRLIVPSPQVSIQLPSLQG